MVTIKEIAEELGVSTTTVSNVIHGKTRKMSAETRKKIEEALVRYHYVYVITMLPITERKKRQKN